MRHQIPDPMTVEDLMRDPHLMYALRARGRRMCLADLVQMLGNLICELRSRSASVLAGFFLNRPHSL